MDSNKYFNEIKNIIGDINSERALIGRYDVPITIDLITIILNNYKISKRNLSLLLGWGELTITRFLNGSVPSLPKSKLLKEILYSPRYYYLLLLLNRHRISYYAFNKSYLAIEKYIIAMEEK